MWCLGFVCFLMPILTASSVAGLGICDIKQNCEAAKRKKCRNVHDVCKFYYKLKKTHSGGLSLTAWKVQVLTGQRYLGLWCGIAWRCSRGVTAPMAGSRILLGLFGIRTSLQLLTKLADVLMIDQYMWVFGWIFPSLSTVPMWMLSLEVDFSFFFYIGADILLCGMCYLFLLTSLCCLHSLSA